MRSGDWKLYFPRSYRTLNGKPGGKDGVPVKYENNIVRSNELYNLKDDPSETTNVYSEYIEKAKQLDNKNNKSQFGIPFGIKDIIDASNTPTRLKILMFPEFFQHGIMG